MDQSPTFACGMCGRCFSDAEQIRLHIQAHTGQQPFRCVVCWPLFYDMSDKGGLQPWKPAVPALAMSAPSTGASVSRVQTSSSASSNETHEDLVTSSPQSSELVSQNDAARKTDAEKSSAVRKEESIGDKSQSESMTASPDKELSTQDDMPPVLQPKVDFSVLGSSKRLKTQEKTMVDLNKSGVGKLQNGSVMASSDQGVSMSAPQKDVLVDKEYPAESLEKDSACAATNRRREVKLENDVQEKPLVSSPAPCDKPLTKRQNGDTAIDLNVATDAHCNRTQADGFLKDADKTAESTRPHSGTEIETVRTKTIRNKGSQNPFIALETTASVCDSGFVSETDLRSENSDIDKDQNLTVADTCAKLPSINVSVTKNLSCIQYSFEELVASADFLENPIAMRELSDSDSQDSFCRRISEGSEQSTSSADMSAPFKSGGRRKKGKPKKLSSDIPLVPVVAERPTQEAAIVGHHACSDQQKTDEVEVSAAQNATQHAACISPHPEADESLKTTEDGHQNDSGGHDNSSVSTTELEVVTAAGSHASQPKTTPEVPVQNVPQDVAEEESLEKPVPVLSNIMTDAGVNFRGVISFLKKFQVKLSPDSKNPERKDKASMDRPENTEGPLLKTADVASLLPNLTLSLRYGENEESSIMVCRENQETNGSAEGSTDDRMGASTNKQTEEIHRVKQPDANGSSKSSTVSEKPQIESKLQTPTLSTETAAAGESFSKNVAVACLSDVHSVSQSISDMNGLITDEQTTDLSVAVDCSKATVSSAPKVGANKHRNDSVTEDVSNNRRSKSLFPKQECKGLSVCLPKLSDSTLQTLLAGKTIKATSMVDVGKSPQCKSSRHSAGCTDLCTPPGQPVNLDTSEGIHQDPQGKEVPDSRRKCQGGEKYPSEIAKNDSSTSCRIPTQEATQVSDEQIEVPESCQEGTDQDSYPEIANRSNPRTPSPKKKTEIQETEKENGSNPRTPSPKKKTEIKETEKEKNQPNHQSIADAKDPLNQTENGASKASEKMVEKPAAIHSSPKSVTKSTGTCPETTRKRKQQRSEIGQMKKSRMAAEKQTMGLKNTDTDQQDVCPQRKESSVDLDSQDKHSVSSNVGGNDCSVEAGSSRKAHSDKQSTPDGKTKARDLVLLGEQVEEASETMSVEDPDASVKSSPLSKSTVPRASDKSSAVSKTISGEDTSASDKSSPSRTVSSKDPSASDESSTVSKTVAGKESDTSDKLSALVRRASEESVENVDLPPIVQPRRARRKQSSSEYYWRSSHAKTCAIVTKGRQNGHVGHCAAATAHEENPVALFNYKVVLENTPQRKQIELLTQQDSSPQSSVIVTSTECDQSHVQEKQTSQSVERTPQTDFAQENTGNQQIAATESVQSETFNLYPAVQIFTPSVAESVKRAATRRKATLQLATHADSKKDKTSEDISEEMDVLSEIPDASSGQKQQCEEEFRRKQDSQKTADEKMELSLNKSESVSLLEKKKDSCYKPRKKLIAYHSQPVYVRPEGIKYGQILCHSCPDCGAVFRKYMKYLFHLANGCKRRFECKICGSSLGRRESLKAHMAIHTGEAAKSCQICGKKLAGRQSLNNHIRIHTGEKPYKCSLCSKSFRQSSGLTSHFRTHSRERPFKCDLCDKAYRCRTTLASHRLSHTGERPYVCSVCNAAFFQQTSLKSHFKVHSNEKPFACDFCLSRFVQKSDLNDHLRLNHPHKVREIEYKKAQEEAKPHMCTNCNRGFNSKFSMRRHMKSFCLLMGKKEQNTA